MTYSYDVNPTCTRVQLLGITAKKQPKTPGWINWRPKNWPFWSVAYPAYPSRTQPQVAVPPNLKLHSRMAPRCEIPAWQIPIILCIKFKPQIHHAYNHGQLSIFQLGSCRKGGKKRSGVRIGNGKSREKASTKSAHAMLVKKKPARFTRKLLQTLKKTRI